MLELIGQWGTNIGLSDAERLAISQSPTKEANLIAGSKCLMAGWTCYVTLIWSLKACMLFFYNRLTYVPHIILSLCKQLTVQVSVSRSRNWSSSTWYSAAVPTSPSSSPSSSIAARSRNISRSTLTLAVCPPSPHNLQWLLTSVQLTAPPTLSTTLSPSCMKRQKYCKVKAKVSFLLLLFMLNQSNLHNAT